MNYLIVFRTEVEKQTYPRVDYLCELLNVQPQINFSGTNFLRVVEQFNEDYTDNPEIIYSVGIVHSSMTSLELYLKYYDRYCFQLRHVGTVLKELYDGQIFDHVRVAVNCIYHQD